MNETKVLSIVVLVVAIMLLPFRGRIVPALRRAIISIRKTHHRVVIIIGLLDVTLLGIMAFALLCAVSGRGPLSTLWALAPWILANPLPSLVSTVILAIVGWRGVTDAKRVITDRTGYLRPVVEGFFGAFMLPIFEFLVRLAPIAYAGIPLYGEAGTWNFVEWLTFIAGVLWESLKAGVLGAALGGLFAAINRLTIKRLIQGRTTACTGSPINTAPGDPFP